MAYYKNSAFSRARNASLGDLWRERSTGRLLTVTKVSDSGCRRFITLQDASGKEYRRKDWVLANSCKFMAESPPKYSVGTWDTDKQAYTPQSGVPSINLTFQQLRQSLKTLREMGYSCHRRRDTDGSYDDNDWCVLVERTDGQSEAEILEGWKR